MTDAIYVSKSDILDLITENNEAGGFTDYSDYSNLWDEVDNMPAANVQPVKQWVKLHDKHPDTEGSYLVCDQYGECEVAKYIPCIKSWFTHKVNGEIRYWTPLPDSPQD